jgi:putative sporulation protein YyaC
VSADRRVERVFSASDEAERFHIDSPAAPVLIADSLYRRGLSCLDRSGALLLLCIGTDRSIGDSLGPLVGTMLQEQGNRAFHVLGTLDNPVHATNLQETIDHVKVEYRSPFVLALDACLGRPESVGLITVGPGALRPGAGVNKTLPAVGHMHVTGVVNVGGFMEYFVLQNTRLSLVMRMARVVAEGVGQGMTRLARLWQELHAGQVCRDRR